MKSLNIAAFLLLCATGTLLVSHGEKEKINNILKDIAKKAILEESNEDNFKSIYAILKNSNEVSLIDWTEKKMSTIFSPPHCAQYASISKNINCPRLLILSSIITNEVKVLDFLLQRKNVDLSSNAEDGFLFLSLALFTGNSDIVKLLIKAGADVNTQEADTAKTPLHMAARNGYIEVIKILLEHGADINAKAANGRNALDFALAGDHDDVVAFLKEKGLQHSVFYIHFNDL